MTGPYESGREARATVAHIYQAGHASTRRGVMAEENYLMLFRACEAAGIDLGSPTSYDRRILAWLAGFEPETCAVVVGLIARAHPPASGDLRSAVLAGNIDLTPEQLRTVLDALNVAADYKRDRAATCPDCAADVCGTCAWRLHLADEYDALAETLQERS
jgi:hypothetical protein